MPHRDCPLPAGCRRGSGAPGWLDPVSLGAADDVVAPEALDLWLPTRVLANA
jgi:hypothetical protein